MNEAVQRNWKEILFNRRMLTCIFLGFTSGMPLYVLFQLVPAWLRTSQMPSYETNCIEDWEEKLERISRVGRELNRLSSTEELCEGLVELVERVRPPRVDAATEGVVTLAVPPDAALEEAELYADMATEEGDEAEVEAATALEAAGKLLERLESNYMLGGPDDDKGAILELNPDRKSVV